MKNQQDIASYDHELKQMITSESQRQEEHIELIASENYASGRVMEAQGSCLTNKYAEGYPSKRYYGGCEYVDQVEVLAQERAKAIFGADYANVQPHSGSQANMAVYFSLLKVGDTILGMNLNEGGHLTHGSDVNVSGRAFHAVAYGLNAEGDIDYDQVEALAKEHQPKLIIAGFSAFSGVADWQRFRQIADQVGAYLLADIAHVAGLIVAGLYPSPLPHAHVVTSTTHKTLRGPRGGIILSKGQPDIEKKLNFGIFPMSQGGPLMHIIAAKAVAFKEAMEADFKVYQQQVLTNAKAMVKVLMSRGYTIVSQGTSNHMFLIDLINHPLNGKEAEHILSQVNITTNKNGVPNDPLPPFVSSGVRIGTPAITTRGFKEAEAQQVATWIADVLDNPTQDLSAIKASVSALCQRFPVYTQ